MAMSSEEIHKAVKEVCATFPKSCKTWVLMVHRANDVGTFSGTVERAAVISMTDAWKLEGKPPTATFAPTDEKAIEYVRSVGTSSAQSGCKMLFIMDLPSNRINVYVRAKDMCFVATAAFGSPMASEVIVLSQFRDQFLLPSTVGTLLVRMYYTVSPPFASYLEQTPLLKAVIRSMLAPIIGIANAMMKRRRFTD
jgi:hypothetical protein